MQNEERINGLETQVRTLKRIVCLVCCLFVFAMIGCASWHPDAHEYNEMSGEWERNGIPLKQYEKDFLNQGSQPF